MMEFELKYRLGSWEEGEHVMANQEILEPEKLIQALLESTGDYAWVVDREGRYLFLNGQMERLLGLSNEEAQKKTYADVNPTSASDTKDFLEKVGRVLQGESITYEHLNWVTNRWFLRTMSPIRDGEGGIAAVSVISKDITKRKRVEEDLRHSEAKFRLLVEQSLQGIVIAQGVPPHLVFVNPAMVQISGYTPEELASVSLDRLIHPDDRAIFFSRLGERFEGKASPSSNEYRAVRKDGETVWIELSSRLLEYDGQPAVQATFMDITERKRMERTLVEGERKYRRLVEGLHEGV
jgi:PAS domain S-box-containing protein